MACAILTPARRLARAASLTVGILVLLHRPGGAETASIPTKRFLCPRTLPAATAKSQRLYRDFKKSVEEGPFYRAILRRRGHPKTCSARTENEAILLSYRFAHNGRLDAKRDPAIEFTEQRMTLSKLTKQEGIALLRAVERTSSGNSGCGILWNEPSTEQPGAGGGTQDIIYRGDVCNCQARLTYQDKILVAFLFRSAC